MHGEPLQVHVYVAALTDGRITYTTPMLAGVPDRLGPTARVRVPGPDGLRSGVDVIITSVRQQTFDDEIFKLHGLDAAAHDLVMVKGSSHFRAGFRHLDADIITADTPGLTTRRVDVFEFEQLDGPRWPLDPHLDRLPWD